MDTWAAKQKRSLNLSNLQTGKARCMAFGGTGPDWLVGQAILDAVSPLAVEAAIANAAQATTVDFNYLLAQAEVESAMNPNARAATSSATGLYQFIESTWLDTVKKHGSRFGLGAVADQIGVTASGSAYVADPAQREAILALRNDPRVASLMAAAVPHRVQRQGGAEGKGEQGGAQAAVHSVRLRTTRETKRRRTDAPARNGGATAAQSSLRRCKPDQVPRDSLSPATPGTPASPDIEP